MRSHPVRAEFVIAGAALLLMFVWGWEAFRVLFGWAEIGWVDDLLLLRATSGAWLFAAALALGIAYIVGAVVVQVTFEWPTRRIVEVVQHRRLSELRRMDRRLVGTQIPLAVSAQSVVLADVFASRRWPTSDAVRLVLSLGRGVLTPELNEQYNYRRGNRQIFVGIIPAVFLVPVNVGLTLASLPLPTLRYVIAGVGFALLAKGATWSYRHILLPAAKYQEIIAQGIILDAAFLVRWSNDLSHAEEPAERWALWLAAGASIGVVSWCWLSGKLASDTRLTVSVTRGDGVDRD